MRKTTVIVVVAVLGLAGVVVYNRTGNSQGQPGAGGGTPGQMGGGPGGGRMGGMRTPMTVEFAPAKRGAVSEQILVVGNLIGAVTVQMVPKVNGRLQSVDVKLGDPIRRGQVIARIEDLELREQVRQAEASFQVAQATIRQRDADLKLAQTNLDRSRSLYERQLLPQQTFDDTEARHQAALAQVDLARAQFEQAKARLDELKITLSNTIIVSPVDGFVGKRFLDPGSFASTNAPILSAVDIRTVRMVANLVERDLRRVPTGTAAAVEVDAFPGEHFKGRVSRVAPVFDPATRTAEMEIEVPNSDFRLKPGMYARVLLTVGSRTNALTVPSNAVVNVEGRSGVFVAAAQTEGGRQGGGNGRQGQGGPSRGDGAPQGEAARQGGRSPDAGAPTLTVRFQPVEIGIRDGDNVEVTSGLDEGTQVITTGAGALRDGDRVVAAGRSSRRGERATLDQSGQPAAPGSTR